MDFKGPWVRRINNVMVALRDAPIVGKLVRKGITVVSYTGRRSGRTFTTPVGYRRKGDQVEIQVMMPDAKTWWRNFNGEGGPLTLELDGAEKVGHATSHRDDRGRVTVRVQL
ncbi:nitroreductase family deazaflavin-dependent oxidoreductase [Lentzea alba]|uniref:nitroreductase/quinone reductase family protein n=1 Tax=Lentzea alba TaxID=2714351 RepID=UPI0039BF1F53